MAQADGEMNGDLQEIVNKTEAVAEKTVQSLEDGLKIIGIVLFCLYMMKGLLIVFQNEQEALHQQFDLYAKKTKRNAVDVYGEGEDFDEVNPIPPYHLGRMASIPYQAILHSYAHLVVVIGIFFIVHTFFYSDEKGLLLAFYKPAAFMLRFAFLFYLVSLALNILIRVRSAVLKLDPVTPFQRSKMMREQKGIFLVICVGMVMLLVIVLR